MAIDRGTTSHQRYTADAREQIGAVNDLKRVYSELADQQVREYERVASASQSGSGKLANAFNETVDAVQKVVEAVRELDRVMQSTFSQRAITQNLPYQINQVRTATMGLVDDMTLSRLAIQANRLQVARSEEDFAKAAAAAAKLGLSVGQDATQSVEDLIGALGRGSTEVLDNLGVSLKAAEAQRLYAEQIGVTVSQLTDEQKAEAFRVIGLQKVIEASERVTISVNESEQAWIAARQQYDKLIRESLPQATQGTTGLWTSLEKAGKAAEDVLPVLARYFGAVVQGLQPLLSGVEFFAGQLAAVGRVVELTSDFLDRASDRASEFGATLLETEVGKWATDATSSVVRFAGEGIDGLTAAVEDYLPFSDDLKRSWDEIARAITGAEVAQHRFGAIARGQQLINGWLAKGKELAQEYDQAEAAKLDKLERQVEASEHAIKLAEAQKQPAAELERLYGEQHLARLRLYHTTGDLAALEREMNAEEIRRAQNASRRRGGGRGPSDAERMQAEGEAMLQQWEAQYRLAELTAELSGEAANEAVYLAGVRYRLDVQTLELEKQVLEATRAKNSVERQRNETKIASIDASIRELELEKQLADQATARAEAQAWRDEWAASVEAERQSLANVVELEDYRASQRMAELEAEGRLTEVAALKMEQAGTRYEQTMAELELKQQLLLMEEPETEAERIRQQMELEQIAHDQRMALAQRDSEIGRIQNAERQRLHDLEQKRKREAWANAQRIAGQSEQLARNGLALSNFIVDSTIRDDEKREKAKLRLEGAFTLAVAAREQVNAVAAFASFNYLQGAAHQAAAILGFAQGGMMMAGIVPGGSGAGAGGGASSPAPAPAPRERETSAAAVTPDSVPAADRAPQRVGGANASNTGGATVINFNAPVNGKVDEEFAEDVARAIKRVGYGTEI